MTDSYVDDKPDLPQRFGEVASAPASIGTRGSPVSNPRHLEDGSSSIHMDVGRTSHSTDVASSEQTHGSPSRGVLSRLLIPRDSSPSPSAVEPQSVLDEVERRLFKRSETAESAAIFGGSNLYLEPGSLSAEVSVLTERTRITSRNDGGREYERAFLKLNGGVEEAESDHSELVATGEEHANTPFLTVVEEALYQARVLSAIGPNNWFIPCTELVRIMREEYVARLLPECWTGQLSEQRRRALAAKICSEASDDGVPSYKRVLATLIIIGKARSIMDFIEYEIDDSRLPLEMVLAKGSPRCLALKDSKTDCLPFSLSWTKKQLSDFNSAQWETQPIFFSVDGDKIVHYKCRPGEIIPFVHNETGYESPEQSPTISSHSSPLIERQNTKSTKNSKASNKTDHDMEGSYGKVFIYRLHPSQQSLKRYTTDGADRCVAVKKLHSTSRAGFNQEYKMLVKLTPLDTPHLAKLLATYEVPHGPQNSRSKEFYLMFECADSNLRKFWREPPPADLPRGYVARWVAAQCRGLAHALGMIHEFKYPVAPLPASDGGEGEAIGAPSSEAQQGPQIDGGIADVVSKPKFGGRVLTMTRDSRTHGFHGDLKPDNILRYCGWKIPETALQSAYSQQPEEQSVQRRRSRQKSQPQSQPQPQDQSQGNQGRSQGSAQDPLGVLQITDFGLSSFHHTETAADIKAKLLAHPYRPPESHLVMKTTQSLDTWTLGCLFLEFLTWLVEGPSGFAKFDEMRRSPGIMFKSEEYFYDLKEEGGWTTVGVARGVLDVSFLCV